MFKSDGVTLRQGLVRVGGIGDGDGMAAFADKVESTRLSMRLAWREELRELGNFGSGQLGIGKLDAGDVGGVKVYRLGTCGSDNGALGLGPARAIGVGEVDVEVGSAAIV